MVNTADSNLAFKNRRFPFFLAMSVILLLIQSPSLLFGSINITNGGTYTGHEIRIDRYAGITTIDGPGSMIKSSCVFSVGYRGDGTLVITRGGAVSCGNWSCIGDRANSIGTVQIDGIGSTWTNSSDLHVGNDGTGILEITNGGLVSVGGRLQIDQKSDNGSFINMASGSMLALFGDADDSLTDFLNAIDGTDAIRYRDESTSNWVDITEATCGEDYTLSYLSEGDLAGYTVLTVGAVPEPSSIILLLTALVGWIIVRRR